MHLFDYKTKPLHCLTPENVAMIAGIHEHKGRQELFIEANYTTDKRLEELVREKAEPCNRSEQEIAGCSARGNRRHLGINGLLCFSSF